MRSLAVAAEQIAAFLHHLPADGELPWFLFDAGYDPVQLTQVLGDTRAASLVRLRACALLLRRRDRAVPDWPAPSARAQVRLRCAGDLAHPRR
jgi:hypothetical protein